MNTVHAAGGSVGIAVLEVGDPELWVAHDEAEPLNPASNMKLVTAWAALRTLGPEHRYLTGLYGRIDGGRVGTLSLRGQGDPSLEMRHLYEMVARLERSGVRSIGDIVVDQSYFDDVYVPPAFDEQPGEWAAFRAPVAAVSLAANTIMFEVRAGQEGGGARVSVVPRTFVQLTSRVKTSRRGDPDNVRVSLAPSGDKLRAQVGGTVAEGSATVRFWRRVDDPRLLAGHGLRQACVDLGLEVDGDVRMGRKQGKLLSAHRSAPLAKLLFALGKHSNNFYAEMIFKSLSVADGAPPASFERSSRKLEELLDDAGISRDGMRFNNGSGLFDAGRLTAGGIARLLAAARRDPTVAPELVAQLSIGGVDGTVRHRFGREGPLRNIRVKTGTLAAVSALSGYILGSDGRPDLAFSVVVNGVEGKATVMRKHIDAFVSAVAASR